MSVDQPPTRPQAPQPPVTPPRQQAAQEPATRPVAPQAQAPQSQNPQSQVPQVQAPQVQQSPATQPVASQAAVPPVPGAEAVATTPVHSVGQEAAHLRDEAAGRFHQAEDRFHGRHDDAHDEHVEEPEAEHSDALPERRSRKGLYAILATLVVLALAGGFVVYKSGLFTSSKDYDSTAGGPPALVEIPEGAPLSTFGEVLSKANVVGSSNAFISAAGNQPLAGGFYALPTEISADTAVQMMQDDEHRVGRVVIPEGLQLESKKGVDGKVTPGIFEMIEDATSFEADGKNYGVTKDQLAEVAAQTPAKDLGVPQWAEAPVEKLTGDYRRIEGLIASGAWENVDPRMDAKETLKSLITQSAARFDEWGVVNDNSSGLMPYDTLVVASIVEREASLDQDFPKVARVILNRMDKDQKLEMDSTANYTADVTNIDVHGDAYSEENDWNTYQKEGLPATPIGAIGEKALESVENPADGRWLYFVTVDKNGKTLFANTYEKHQANRQIACDNKLLTTGCGGDGGEEGDTGGEGAEGN